jgi:hypothetical protein
MPALLDFNPPRILASPQVRAGATIYADFDDPAEVGKWFDVSGFSFGTDSGDPTGAGGGARAVLFWTTSNTEASILIKPQFASHDFEVTARFRVYSSPSASTRYDLLARYSDASNYERASKDFAANEIQVEGMIDGSPIAIGPAFAQADETAGIWRARAWFVGDLFWARFWPAASVEPDWQIVTSRAAGGDLLDFGQAGFAGFATGTAAQSNLSELTVTPLPAATENILQNPDFSIISTDVPAKVLRWNTHTLEDNDTASVELVDDPTGIYGRVMRLERTSTNSADWAGIEQEFYRRGGTGIGRAGRNYDLFQAQYLEVMVCSMANNVRHLIPGGGNFLGVGVVIYWYDESGTVTNVSEGAEDGQFYYGGLGPRGVLGGSNGAVRGAGGEGTWAWYLTPLRIPVGDAISRDASIQRGTLDVTFHDTDAAGVLHVAYVQMRPVS